MYHRIPSFALLVTVATGAAVIRCTEPCPLHGTDVPGKVIKDEYIVRLHSEYTLEEHFKFLGYDLSNATKFSHLQAVNSYTIRIDEDTVHNGIRYDPGVEYVAANMVFEPKHHWYDDTKDEKKERLRSRKRWEKLAVELDWWTRMSVKWDKQPSITEGKKEKADILQDSGKGVDIYIMDSGIRITHELFIEKDRGGARDFHTKYVDDPDFADNKGHGTFVAGMAHMNAPWATVVNVKIDGKGADYSRLVTAINDVTSEHNDRKGGLDSVTPKPKDWRGSVINMSWEEIENPVFRAIVDSAIKAGIQVITSAGNGGKDGGTIPCNFPDVICVGAVNKEYKKQKTSNFGTDVYIYAPGERLTGPGHTADDSWVRKSGTSMAAPAVAAISSIFVSYENIRDDSGIVRKRLTENSHKDILVDETDNKAIPNLLVHTGLQHPDRKDHWPYVGLTGAQEPDPELVDGSNLPTFASPDVQPEIFEDSEELFVHPHNADGNIIEG